MKAIYVRTSTDENSGEGQLHELRGWCETQGWKNVREYIDIGEGGTKSSRPQWDILYRDIQHGKVDTCVCTEISRLGRSTLNVVLALDDFYRSGCRVVLVRQGLDYATPTGRAVATILVAVAQLERDQIRERIVAGVRKAKEAGTRSGKAIGRPRTDFTREEILGMIDARRDGQTWEEIAEGCKRKESTIRRAVGDQGVARGLITQAERESWVSGPPRKIRP